MATYIISYDLRKPDRDYESLYQAIRAYGTYAHIQQSVWAIVTEHNATQIRDRLSLYMDQNDRIFVVKSGREAAWRNVICNNEWLSERL